MPARLTPPLTSPEAREQLFAPLRDYKAIGLGVSGGPDSVGLMLMVKQWADETPDAPTIFVYSVDHGLRPEAAGEVHGVLSLAARLGLAARGLVWSDDKPATGIQEAARAARYRLIREAMRQDGAELLLTAHHISDQAETVLMRLAHGSGIEGLKGMQAFSEIEGLKIFRPLLDVDPKELHGLVADAGVEAVNDPSNADEHYERVRWRAALPQLTALGIDPPTLLRLSRRMADADAALAKIADAAFDDLVKLDGFGAARIERVAYDALGSAVATRVLARVLANVGGHQKAHALGQIEKLHDSIGSESALKNTTLLGCVVRADEHGIVVARELGRSTPADLPLAPGSEIVWDNRFRIRNVSDAAGFTAGVADYMPRHKLQEFLGFKVTAPAEAIRTAPIVRNGEGEVLALGGWSFDPRIAVELIID
ncbi:hypothetical protein GCM10007989_37110 [Devosia pacifica]|uniref:tRNA(Ile)-lysidine synthase n=1 Tax=Devosia pacifica TaxID=1335967 RepID=A0A918VZJ9_9HYPH|nr:tRNA lysidine(34) synthetase TilS [Devosia pacifica]GHA37801.1 hypothetical protein GCM10007989_37110 [Devosia pacifica]